MIKESYYYYYYLAADFTDALGVVFLASGNPSHYIHHFTHVLLSA